MFISIFFVFQIFVYMPRIIKPKYNSRPNFRVGVRRKTSTVSLPTTTTTAPSTQRSTLTSFSRPTKIFPPRRIYLTQSTTAAGILESQVSASTSKPTIKYKFVPRKPLLRTTTTTTTTEKLRVTENGHDQMSESSNQQSMEKEVEINEDEETTQLAYILQNIQKAPIPNRMSTTTTFPVTSKKTGLILERYTPIPNTIDTTIKVRTNDVRRTTSKPISSVTPQIILNKAIITTPQTYHTIRKIPTRNHIRYSSTVPSSATQPVSTLTVPRRNKPFEKLSSNPSSTLTGDYDYYDNVEMSILSRLPEHSKVLLHSNGNIECLDQGNFPHPISCKKFISCAKMENGKVLGWEYTCPKNLSFDPIGGMCNWSAGLGCDE